MGMKGELVMADKHGMILEDVARQMTTNLDVYDVDGHKVGKVVQYDTAAGWMMVEHGMFNEKHLYIPFSVVTNIDQREVYVSAPMDALQRDYSSPPARTTVAATEDDLGVVETTAVTAEPSGYNGAPVVVERTRVDDFRRTITPKMKVYAATGEEIGQVKRYDPVTGWMLVEKGVFTRRDLYVPVTVVDAVDPEAKTVYLTVSTNDLQRMSDTAPADVLFVEARVS
jgi:hypothetical protein